MANKLSTITTQYHTYKVDQVLTHTQLNESIAFFEDQDRLTRVFLNGVGIVCGFNVSRPYSGTVRISQGIGVTTDGDMLKLLQESNDPEQPGLEMVSGAVDYTFYREFEDLNGNYTKFTKDDDSQISLYEIVPVAKSVETDTPLADFENLNDRVVVLYLETFSKEAELCSGIDCDNQGVEQVARLRVLLTDEEGAERLLAEDNVYQKLNAKKIYSQLGKIKLRRVLLTTTNTQALQRLENSYYDSITATEIEKLADGLKSIADLLGANLNVNSLQFFMEPPGPKLVNSFQYHYDWLRDVIATYHELIDTLFELNATCLPDIAAFPKHLLLGFVGNNNQAEQYRHSFYKSPITGDTSITATLQSLLTRLNVMLNAFQATGNTIQITPSKFRGELGERAIPFYYKASKSLLDHWSFAKHQRGQTDEILQYDHKVDNQEAVNLTSLEYDLTEVDFYRIEGHQGNTADQALITLNDMVQQYNLDFDVKILSINEIMENIRMEDYKCQFEDLMVLLEAWNQELACIAGKISQYFTDMKLEEILAEEAEDEKVEVKESETKDTVRTKGIVVSHSKETDKVFQMIKEGTINYSEAARYYPEYFAGTDTRKTESKKDYLNTISDNVVAEEGKFGMVVDKVLKDNEERSLTPDQFKVQAQKEAVHYIGDIQLTDAVKKAIVDKPIDIIASAIGIGAKIPEKLSDLEDNYLTDYGASIDRLCKDLKEFRGQVKKLSIREQYKTEFQSQAIFFSSICCADKKLEVLKKEIEVRKKSILEALQLHKFVEHHPGLDHRAGVSKGGTFVMVYYANPSENLSNGSEGIEDEVKGKGVSKESDVRNKITLIKAIEEEKERSVRTGNFVKYDALLEEMVKAGEISKEYLLKDSRLIKGYGKNYKTTLKDKTVVADFMLPYRCCSDCNPINFIVPRPVVFLNLGTETYCLGLEQDPISFEVIPKDATVKVEEGVTGVVISGQFISIDPEAFNPELIGKPISFTVNGEPTDAQLIVHEAPLFTIKLPEQPVISGLEVTFEPSQTIDGAAYEWDFGDDNGSEDEAPSHTYDLPEEVKSVTVSLTITPENGACPRTVTEELEIGHIIIDDTVDLALEPNEFCRGRESTPTPFDVVPEDGKVAGTGVTTNQEGKYVFDPNMVPQSQLGRDITGFTVNGQSVDLVVRVFQSPTLLIDTKVDDHGPNEGYTVTFTITNPPSAAKEYQWIIDGKEQEVTEETSFSQSFNPDVKSVSVSVKAHLGNICEEASSDEITVALDEKTEGNCTELGREEVAKMIGTHQEFINSPQFKEMGNWGQDTMMEAFEAMNSIDQKLADFQNGSANNSLLGIFDEQFTNLVSYLIEMHPGDGADAPMKSLYRDNVRLFYLILRCQEPRILIESKKVLNQLTDKITSDFNLLEEGKVNWDPNKTMGSFYEETTPYFEGVDFIMEAIKEQTNILGQ
ncbi:hypothetical protein DN752_24275 [Echinicola strongylocentroti]|uniref:PKD domain-containing protein n=1 Tax=Echinicola strongylocentroti TaxID=1795355 RepID=A0A2Z4IQR4_9BACT|nr:PKD domain-containing protein [Echinicola strongylocentroti]AWW32988.1 hypothetical protein DN752_24275 [Echinicola strongylocentroti]